MTNIDRVNKKAKLNFSIRIFKLGLVDIGSQPSLDVLNRNFNSVIGERMVVYRRSILTCKYDFNMIRTQKFQALLGFKVFCGVF
jgi:hypothetical protein